MINTVPRGITLSKVIKPQPVKVDAVQLSVTDGAMRLKAMLRVRIVDSYALAIESLIFISLQLATANPKRKVTLLWESRDRKSCNRNICSAPFIGTNDTTTALTKRAGMTPQKYHFDTPINATLSASKFWFEVDERNGQKPIILNNGGTGYVVQDRVLFDPKRSSFPFSSGAWSIVAAVSGLVSYNFKLKVYDFTKFT